MTDRPIPFSGAMVRALLDGRKTQTRRIVKGVVPPPPDHDAVHPLHTVKHETPYLDAYCSERKTADNPRGISRTWCWWTRDDRQCLPTFKVGHQPGDRLWVREAWQTNCLWDGLNAAQLQAESRAFGRVSLYYPADGGRAPGSAPISAAGRYRHGRFMPRWASRLTLTVTAVRVERLQDISEADAIAEGLSPLANGRYFCGHDEEGEITAKSPITAYAWVWNAINGPDAWAANPWVAAYSFTVERRNIDAGGPTP